MRARLNLCFGIWQFIAKTLGFFSNSLLISPSPTRCNVWSVHRFVRSPCRFICPPCSPRFSLCGSFNDRPSFAHPFVNSFDHADKSPEVPCHDDARSDEVRLRHRGRNALRRRAAPGSPARRVRNADPIPQGMSPAHPRGYPPAIPRGYPPRHPRVKKTERDKAATKKKRSS